MEGMPSLLEVIEARIARLGLEWIYVGIMLIFGTLLVFLTPPWMVPDEINHAARVYQISEGVLMSPVKILDGKYYACGKLPLSFETLLSSKDFFQAQHTFSMQQLNMTLSLPLDDHRTAELIISNTCQYSPLSYLPQSVGAFLARSMELSAGWTFYVMRWAAIPFVAGCIFLAFRLFPEKKRLIFLLAVMPMTLAQSASCSADAVTIALSILLTAFFFSLRTSKQPFTCKELCFLVLSAVALGFLKQVYGVILLLFFLIPFCRMGSKKRFMFFGLLLIGIFALTTFVWLSLMAGGKEIELPIAHGADPAAQLAFFLGDVSHYIGVLFFTLQEKIFQVGDPSGNYILQFVGVLGWLTVVLPKWFYLLYLTALLLITCCGELTLAVSQRLWIGIATSLAVFVIFLNQYLTWTPVGAEWIDGVQGRYMIPLALMFLCGGSFFKALRYENTIAVAVGITSAIVTLERVITYFY